MLKVLLYSAQQKVLCFSVSVQTHMLASKVKHTPCLEEMILLGCLGFSFTFKAAQQGNAICSFSSPAGVSFVRPLFCKVSKSNKAEAALIRGFVKWRKIYYFRCWKVLFLLRKRYKTTKCRAHNYCTGSFAIGCYRCQKFQCVWKVIRQIQDIENLWWAVKHRGILDNQKDPEP